MKGIYSAVVESVIDLNYGQFSNDNDKSEYEPSSPWRDLSSSEFSSAPPSAPEHHHILQFFDNFDICLAKIITCACITADAIVLS